MRHSSGLRRGLLLVALLSGVVLVPTAAQADPNFYGGPIFGTATAQDGTLLVADSSRGIVNGDDGSLIASLPGVADIAPRGHGRQARGKLWAITSGEDATSKWLYRVDGGIPTKVADLFAFEAANNPHPANIDSNPFDVVDLGGGKALVADAGGNDLLRVNEHGQVELVAVLPDELVSTANIKHLAGCPHGAPDFCDLPPMIPAEPVATSVAIGPDGAYYVGELKGFPAPTGESRIWRIDPHARGVQCGSSPLCTVAFDGFTSVIDLSFGPGGKLYVAQIDDASWAAVEIFEGQGAVGGSVHACDVATTSCATVVDGVPILTSITFRRDHLWGAIQALIPGQADVVPLK